MQSSELSFSMEPFAEVCTLYLRTSTESAVSVELIVSRLLNPEFVCVDLPVTLALQETSSWNAKEMHVPGFVVYENVFGLTSLLVSDLLCNFTGNMVIRGEVRGCPLRVYEGYEFVCAWLG